MVSEQNKYSLGNEDRGEIISSFFYLGNDDVDMDAAIRDILKTLESPIKPLNSSPTQNSVYPSTSKNCYSQQVFRPELPSQSTSSTPTCNKNFAENTVSFCYCQFNLHKY